MKRTYISNDMPAVYITGILWILLMLPAIFVIAELSRDISVAMGIAMLIFFIPLALMIYFSFVPAGYHATTEYVVFRKGLRRKKIYYSSIRSINVTQQKYSHTRYGATLFENLLTIETDKGKYEFNENAGSVRAEDLLANNGDLVKLLNSTELIELAQYIEGRI